MNFNEEPVGNEPANKILVAKHFVKPGMVHGWASRAGCVNLKEREEFKYQLCFVKKGEWLEMQLFQYGLGAIPEKQSWGEKSVDVSYHNRLKEENKMLKEQIKMQGKEIKKLKELSASVAVSNESSVKDEVLEL